MKRYIAYRDDENNYYHDSYFYTMYVDTVEEKIIKHTHSTTAMAGSNPFPHEHDIRLGDEKIIELARTYAKRDVLNKPTYISSGDIVSNINPRARKHKGVTFKVDRIIPFRGRYGKVLSETLIGKDSNDQEIKISSSNCKVVKYGEEKLQTKISRIVIGLD